jgi:hypothetical protein
MIKRHLFLFVIVAMFFAGCEEIAPTVTGSMPGGPDTGGPDITNQKRQVLIEEFTGVRCVNCPAGSAAIEDLLAIHGEQLVAVSIHAGEFAPPYNESNFDFRTSVGDQIINYVGIPFGFPTAVVNRRKFDGNFGLQLGLGKWAGHIAEELLIDPKVKIGVVPEYNAGNGNLDIEVTLLVQEDILDDDVRISLMVTESGIKDYQLTPDGKQGDYTHKHVLRGMVTNFDGDVIPETLVAGTTLTKNFNYTIPAEWVAENCEIIAFVNLGGDSKDILQAIQVHLVE